MPNTDVALRCRVVGFRPVGALWDASYEYRCSEHPEWMAFMGEGLAFVHLQQHGWENRDIHEALEKLHLAAVTLIGDHSPTVMARLA